MECLVDRADCLAMDAEVFKASKNKTGGFVESMTKAANNVGDFFKGIFSMSENKEIMKS
jgi:hypothetical protein